MCKCEVLKKVPVGQKRRMIIEEGGRFLGIKKYETVIVLDRYKEKTDIFLKHLTILEDDMNSGTVIDIKFCHFCGRDLNK